MIKSNETWTRAHDLALVYVALAYGADNALSDAEVDTIIATLQDWEEGLSRSDVQEIVLEAMTVYLQENSSVEVTRTMRTLRNLLSEDERKRALADVVRIAEADGVLLSSETSMITALAEIWDLKAMGEKLLEQSTVEVADVPAWSLLHDMSLICIVLAHSTDSELVPAEIEAILERLHQWQPDLDEAALQDVIRDALAFYASEPDRDALAASLKAIRQSLPPIQRIAFLDDLMYIAESDGDLDAHEDEMLRTLSEALGVEIRL